MLKLSLFTCIQLAYVIQYLCIYLKKQITWIKLSPKKHFAWSDMNFKVQNKLCNQQQLEEEISEFLQESLFQPTFEKSCGNDI